MRSVDAKSVIEKGKPITVNEIVCGAEGMMLDFIKNPQTQEEEKPADTTMPNSPFQAGKQFELGF